MAPTTWQRQRRLAIHLKGDLWPLPPGQDARTDGPTFDDRLAGEDAAQMA